MFITLKKLNGTRLTLPLMLQFAIVEREGEEGGCDILVGGVRHQVVESHDEVTAQYMEVLNRAAGTSRITVETNPLEGIPPTADEIDAEFDRAARAAEARAAEAEPAPDVKPARVRNRNPKP